MSFEYSTRVAVLAGALTLGGALALQGGQADRPAYLNPDLPVDARAADLVSRMTLDEKISQLTNDAAARAPRRYSLRRSGSPPASTRRCCTRSRA